MYICPCFGLYAPDRKPAVKHIHCRPVKAFLYWHLIEYFQLFSDGQGLCAAFDPQPGIGDDAKRKAIRQQNTAPNAFHSAMFVSCHA